MNKKNKVMLVASFEEGAYSFVVEAGLKDLGYEVLRYDPRQLFSMGYKHPDMILDFNWKYNAFDPDYILAIKAMELPIDCIKDKPAMKINWWLDNFKRYSETLRILNNYDKYFLSESNQGHPWLPIGIHPAVHKPMASDNPIYKNDVIFAGTAHLDRGLRIIKIMRNLPYKMKIFGNAWGSEGDFFGINVHGKAIYWDELMKAYTMSHIILNNHYEETITPNMRAIEAPASGTAMLSDTGKGIKECLREGEEFIPYKDTREARYLICKYMEEPEELYRIGENGYRRIRKDHLIHDKIKVLLK